MKQILITGDFMIDVFHVVSAQSALSEFHGDIQAQRRVRPDLRNERVGAAGIIAKMLRNYSDLTGDAILGLGLWNPMDDGRWAALNVAVNNSEFKDNDFRLLRLDAGAARTITTIKNRVWRYAASKPPEFVSRIDQDPLPLSSQLRIPDCAKQYLKNGLDAVVVADFCKGAVSETLLGQLERDVPWYVESKFKGVKSRFKRLRIDTFFFNRREATRAAQELGARIDEIPPGRYVTEELLLILEFLFQKLSAKQMVESSCSGLVLLGVIPNCESVCSSASARS